MDILDQLQRLADTRPPMPGTATRQELEAALAVERALNAVLLAALRRCVAGLHPSLAMPAPQARPALLSVQFPPPLPPTGQLGPQPPPPPPPPRPAPVSTSVPTPPPPRRPLAPLTIVLPPVPPRPLALIPPPPLRVRVPSPSIPPPQRPSQPALPLLVVDVASSSDENEAASVATALPALVHEQRQSPMSATMEMELEGGEEEEEEEDEAVEAAEAKRPGSAATTTTEVGPPHRPTGRPSVYVRNPDGRYLCGKCTKTFKNSTQMLRHYARKHRINGHMGCPMDTCAFTSASLNVLRAHIHRTHKK